MSRAPAQCTQGSFTGIAHVNQAKQDLFRYLNRIEMLFCLLLQIHNRDITEV